MNVTTNRRTFLWQTSASMAAAAAVSSGRTYGSALEKINLASVGVGGKGASDLRETAVGHNVVAICDVDANRLAAAAKDFPQAKTYTDWRKLLEQKDIDAVTISTPDHMHAAISLAAMSLGKHVYTQKPLTHNVREARQMQLAAEKHRVVTQMGIQHHSSARIKNAVQIIRDGVIGKVREVHTWTDRPGAFWKQGLQRPERSDPVPSSLNWDLWLGVAPQRPFVSALFHPFHWRGWWDYGTGAMGDMGCHIWDPVFTALELEAPTLIEAQGPEPDLESGPLWCEITYEFPGTRHTTDTVKVVWYEAGRQPDPAIIKAPQDWPGSLNGILFVGERGNLFVGFPEAAQLFPLGDFSDYQLPQHEDNNHYTQWTQAILGQGQTSCPFSYAGPLTEAVLLGNVAYRSGGKVTWDQQEMKTLGNDNAQQFIGRTYRTGWELSPL